MPATFTLEGSKKMWEIVGWYATDSQWRKELYLNEEEETELEMKDGEAYEAFVNSVDAPITLCTPVCANGDSCHHYGWGIPAPIFEEALRIFVKVGEKMQFKHGSWRRYQATRFHAARMVRRYMEAPTEEQGTRDAESYLMSLLTPNSSKERV